MKKFFLAFIFLVGCQTSVPMDVEVVEEVAEVSEVPVLMYHYVRDVERSEDDLGWRLSVSPKLFEEHLAELFERGYESVKSADLVDGLVPEKSVVLSFDDGTVDFYETAWPLLKQYGFGASIAIVSDFVGRDGYMSREQIEELIEEGVEVLGHSATHKDLRGGVNLEVEILESKRDLEEMFGVDIVGFVYPSGKYNEDVLKAVKEAGYNVAFTVKEGVANLSDGLLELRRMRMDNRESFRNLRF